MVRKLNPKPRRVNFVFLDGGVGDHIGSLVAIDYVTKKYPWITPLVWVPTYLKDFAKHVLPKVKDIHAFSEMKEKYNQHLPTKTTKWDGNLSAMKIHVVDYAFLKLCDENPSLDNKNYLQIRPDEIDISMLRLPEKYIVITAGYTAKVREFPASHVNKIADFALSKGYTPVFLGQTKTETGTAHVIEGNFNQEVNLAAGVNLLNKTTLLEAAKIMGNAKAVLGVDNGLLHVAGCTNTLIIGGFTTVSPEVRMAVRNGILGWNYFPIEPDKTLPCRGCQEKTNFLYGHDYRDCIYNDYVCTTQMTANKFIANLERLL